MKLVKGAQARTTTGLRVRKGPGVSFAIEATLVKDALVMAVADPAGGWCEIEFTGHTKDGKVIYSEPDERSSVEATRSAGEAAEWQEETQRGFVGTGYLVVIDGPVS